MHRNKVSSGEGEQRLTQIAAKIGSATELVGACRVRIWGSRNFLSLSVCLHSNNTHCHDISSRTPEAIRPGWVRVLSRLSDGSVQSREGAAGLHLSNDPEGGGDAAAVRGRGPGLGKKEESEAPPHTNFYMHMNPDGGWGGQQLVPNCERSATHHALSALTHSHKLIRQRQPD